MVDIATIEKDIDIRIEKHKYPSSLYHYTSISTLYNILSHQEIWFGNTATMNDRKEIKYFVEMIKNELESEFSRKMPNALSKINIFFEEISKQIDESYPYAMCLSKLEDDAAQWERYADNANGACIIFNTKNLMKAFYEWDLLFCDVYYDTNIAKHEHYKILSDFFEKDELKDFDEKGLMDNIIACGYAHKHKSFRSEQEVRVINLWNNVPKEAKVEMECSSGVIKKFMKFNIKKRCDSVGLKFGDLFEGIVLGPRSAQNIDILKRFVEECGIDNLHGKISKSDSPLC